MRSIKLFLTILIGTWLFTDVAFAYYNPREKKPGNPANSSITFREKCVTAGAQIDQDVNNVRARLTTGGDVWWNLADGKYVVPKPTEPGQPEPSSIFAGAVWLGGVDPGGNLKIACQQYGHSGSAGSDFWPGPLNPETGITTKTECDQWDQFFEVQGSEIDEHLRLYNKATKGEIVYTEDMIPLGIRRWPGRKNPHFFDAAGFELPTTDQGLAGFADIDQNFEYTPLGGDFPVIEIRGCDEKEPQYPDEMIFWVYNDEGGGQTHGESGGDAIRMEVQVQAFGYTTNDQLNDMTFQRYKLINRAEEDIDSMYFAMWADMDLGCDEDDYIGCDTARSLAYTYNADALDGNPGATCPSGADTYGDEIPIIGIDYFRGPRDENLKELGMTSFTYMIRAGSCSGAVSDALTDPNLASEFYYYLQGRWKDGTPYTFGGDAYDPLSTDYIKYAFVDNPNGTDWNMCTAELDQCDRRTVQATGPLKLQPGATNELIIGVPWVPDVAYPCPDISDLQFADDLCQALFNNCFDITDGPDAPDIDWIELDRELIGILSNGETSNNFKEHYEETGLDIPGYPAEFDTTYNFEGYIVYQLRGPKVGVADYDDLEQARPVFQVDVKNGITTQYQWKSLPNPIAETDPAAAKFVFYPEVKITGVDGGIKHTFKVTEDQFAATDRRLLNHKKYYYSTKAYAYNDYLTFNGNNLTPVGQRNTYLEGRKNIRLYAPIPRPILDKKLNASYGDGPVITRIDGVGVGQNFLDISDESHKAILDGTLTGEITYKPGRGPINVTIYNPLEVKDGEFEVTFVDGNMGNTKLDNDTYWKFRDLNGTEVLSDTSIFYLNEQILGEYGFTISIGQTEEAGDPDAINAGAIGYEQEYGSLSKPFWFSGIEDGYLVPELLGLQPVFDYVKADEELLPLAQMGNGYFVPYQMTDCTNRDPVTEFPFYITPAWRRNCGLVSNPDDLLENLNNVDIVFTADKSLWSRCVIVETASEDYINFANKEDGTPVTTEGDAAQFDLRRTPSVGKYDTNGDGKPEPDGHIAPPDFNPLDIGQPTTGMGWFPGYAIDVETGKRLNVFFGENSVFSAETGYLNAYPSGSPKGRDMLFNPDPEQFLFEMLNNVSQGGQNLPLVFYAGGQHFVYVTNEEYDECKYLRTRFDPAAAGTQEFKKINGLKQVQWAGIIVPNPEAKMEPLGSGETGLIPNDITIKLRVYNPYDVEEGTDEFNGYPTYRFKLEGRQASKLDESGIENALNMINMVPNPYYAYSNYETSRLTNVVKITNLPAKCTVTIYSLDGKFIRQYNRDEAPGAPNGNAIPSAQIIPDLEWDLKNSKGIPIAAGAYLIHVDAPGYGERTLKWFGITRQFDPTGL